MQGCSDAGMQGCRGAKMQECRDTGMQGYRDAGMQGLGSGLASLSSATQHTMFRVVLTTLL